MAIPRTRKCRSHPRCAGHALLACLALLLLLAGGLLFLLRTGGVDPAAQGGGNEVDLAGPAEIPGAELLPDGAGRAEAVPLPRQDVEAQGGDAEGRIRSTHPLSVLLLSEGRPAAGVTVYWYPVRSGTPALWECSKETLQSLAAGGGGQATTGADGRVNLLLARQTCSLVAWSGDLFAHDSVNLDWIDAGIELTMVLKGDRELSIQILDHRGQPATDLLMVARTGTDSRWGSAHFLRVGKTDAHGMLRVHLVALFEHALRQQMGNQITPDDPAVTDLVPWVLGCDDAGLRVDLSALEQVPRTYSLPPTGSLHVQCRDREGVRLDRIWITRMDPGTTPARIVTRVDVEDPRIPAVVQRVGLHWRGVVEARFNDPETGIPTSFKADCIGPTAADQQVRIFLEPDVPPCIIGRLKLGESPPQDGSLVRFTGTAKPTGSAAPEGSQRPLTLSGAVKGGRFVFSSGRTAGGRTMEDCTIGLWEAGAEVATAKLGTLVLPRSGALDLGELQLLRHPVVAAGQVFVDGMPAPSIRVRVHVWDGDRGRNRWRNLVTGMSGPDGRFELHGKYEGGALQIVAEAASCQVMEPVPLAAGRQGLALQLSSSAAVDVVMLLPQADDFGAVLQKFTPVIELRPVAGIDASASEAASVQVGQGQRLRVNNAGTSILEGTPISRSQFRKIAAGRYTLAILLPWVPEVVLEQEIKVEPADQARELQVERIDLREVLRAATLTIAYKDGQVPAIGTARIQVGSGSDRLEHSLRSGKLTLYLASRPVDVLVTGPFGRQSVSVPAMNGDHTVLLERVPVVELFPELADLPERPPRVGLAFHFQNLGSGQRWSMQAGQNPGRSLKVPGGIRLKIALNISGIGGNVQLAVQPEYLDLTEGVLRPRFQIDPAELRAAFDKVSRKQ